MNVRFALIAVALCPAALTFAAPAVAQEAMEEIVVTASRYQNRHEDVKIPAITLRRRADAVVVQVRVESDSREAAVRRREIEQALGDIQRRVGGAIGVALLDDGPAGEAGETRLRPFSVAKALQVMRPGGRPDTSVVDIQVRTPVSQSDTPETVETRLDAFIAGVSRPGRVTLTAGAKNPTLLNPAQYRGEMIAAILADGRKALALAGPGHALRVEGLEGPIAWRASGDLVMTLYLPHRMMIAPGAD